MKKKALISSGKDSMLTILKFLQHHSKDKMILFRRIATLILVLTFIFSSFTSFLKAKETEVKKEGQIQKDEIKQAQVVIPQKSKPGAKGSLSKEPNPLTEEEKKEFKKFQGVFGQEGMSEEEALQNLKILLKGGPDTIPYYQDPAYGDEKGRLEKYSEDFCTVMQRGASLKCKKCYDLILLAIKEKATPQSIRPSVRGCAAETIGWYGDLKEGKWQGDKRAVPVLKEIISDKDPEVRLQAAGSLLSLGEGDIALPILDELVKEGIHQSTFALEKFFAPEERVEDGKKRIVRSHTKLWDKRGKEILMKALNYSSDEVKAFAAARLVEMGVELKLVETVVTSILEKFKHKTVEDYGLSKSKVPSRTGDLNAPADKYYSDGRACSHAIYASQVLGSEKVKVILKEISEINAGWAYVCRGNEAKGALTKLGGKR